MFCTWKCPGDATPIYTEQRLTRYRQKFWHMCINKFYQKVHAYIPLVPNENNINQIINFYILYSKLCSKNGSYKYTFFTHTR